MVVSKYNISKNTILAYILTNVSQGSSVQWQLKPLVSLLSILIIEYTPVIYKVNSLISVMIIFCHIASAKTSIEFLPTVSLWLDVLIGSVLPQRYQINCLEHNVISTFMKIVD